MSKIKISAVSYTNTKPFIYGLTHSGIMDQIDLSLDIPTDCAAKLIDNKVDIGLIPVAAIPSVPAAEVISDYCIGSVGAVNSVFIFSNLPVDKITTVSLDAQSRTSNNLAKVLLKNHWKQHVKFVAHNEPADAIVLIGDRTFGKSETYAFSYDLGQEWMNFTGLPFVYAAWVANKSVPKDFIRDFNAALKLGLENRKTLLATLAPVDGFDLEDYLMNKLDFELTPQKREALQLFLKYIAEL